MNNGPKSVFVDTLAQLRVNGSLNAFSGLSRSQYSSENAFESYRADLKPIADLIRLSDELESHHLFLCSFWASVRTENPSNDFIPINTVHICRDAAIAWATILMAHRTYHCRPKCTATKLDENRSYIWNDERLWYVTDDWYTSGLSLALSYDVLFDGFTLSERVTIRSAIALLVTNRQSWGNTIISDGLSPNAEMEPHRIFSNWAMYSSNLYLTNLAIEHEEGFLPYAKEVMQGYSSNGFDPGLNDRFEAMINAFFRHSLYPDGSSFEDGYTFHTAIREGALAFIAYDRRVGKLLDTPRMRNAVHSVAQMMEPWKCAPLVGHASGGGFSYPVAFALFRYSYPNGTLPNMLWAQRAGSGFDNNVCRIMYTQTMLQMSFLGGEHLNVSNSIPEAPEHLSEALKAEFPLSYVMTRRGLIVMRGSHAERAAYMHFDARPDSFFVGHDNADRGVITFSALGRRWLDDLDWRENVDSRKHSVLHINGLSQAVKAPSATILSVKETGDSCIAAADLSYSYNVQWAQAWQGPNSGNGQVIEYLPNGRSHVVTYEFLDDEPHTPWELGWPFEDDAKDLGFNRSMSLTRVPNIGFRGINEWRRPYRSSPLLHYVRSTVMLRSENNDVGVAIVVDDAALESGPHTFESYLILSDGVEFRSGTVSCTENRCEFRLSGGDGRFVDVHIFAQGNNLDTRVERFDGHTRVVVRSSGVPNESFWMILHAHDDNNDGFRVEEAMNRCIAVTYEKEKRFYRIREADHVVVELRNGTAIKN